MKNKQYCYWNTEHGEDGDDGFWMLFDRLEDAVSEGGDGIEIYEVTPKFLGSFKRKVSLVKSNAKGKKK